MSTNVDVNAMIGRMLMDGIRDASETGSSKSTKGKSWLEVIAEAMGRAQGKLAAKMIDLTKELEGLSSAAAGDGPGAKKAANDFQIAMSKFQATSQLFSMLSNANATGLKSIGEGMTSIARKS